MDIRIEIDDSQVRGLFRDMDKQIRFAASKALNETAQKVREAMPRGLQDALDRPTVFTTSTRGTFIERATKERPVAEVVFKDRQASYLQYQVFGGVRRPNKRALRLPADVRLDAFGNLPKGIIQQLIAVARKETGLPRRKARRIRVSNKLELFYGDPADVGNRNFPPGIYKIVDKAGGSALVPVIVFPETTASYRKRVDLEAIARPVVASAFAPAFAKALGEALASAR